MSALLMASRARLPKEFPVPVPVHRREHVQRLATNLSTDGLILLGAARLLITSVSGRSSPSGPRGVTGATGRLSPKIANERARQKRLERKRRKREEKRRTLRAVGPALSVPPAMSLTLKEFAQPLLDRLPTRRTPRTTRLGDWYANLLFRPDGQVVLFVNARSLLPVLVPASPGSMLVTRFPQAAADVLLALGVPAAVVEAESHEMTDARIGKTASRQVLGSMNDFAYLMDAFRKEPVSMTEAAVKLAKVPCSPIHWKHPADAVLELLVGGR